MDQSLTLPWWQTFFDSDYTTLWTDAGMFDSTREEVTGIVGMLRADRELRILDIPCGFGRHSAALHAMGHEVTGVDASAEQLAMAAERNPGPVYLRGDMRHPPEGPFDAVLNLFSSFGYFDERSEDQAALDAWYRVLAPYGRLLLETNHRDRLAKIMDPDQELPVGTDGTMEFGYMDWITGVVHRTVRLADGRERTFRVRTYTATDLVSMLSQAGFSDIECFGDWSGIPIGPDTRLIIRARRP